MTCIACITALEQGAFAVYELAAFHPELLVTMPRTFARPQDVGEWLVRCAGALRQRAIFGDPSGNTHLAPEGA